MAAHVRSRSHGGAREFDDAEPRGARGVRGVEWCTVIPPVTSGERLGASGDSVAGSAASAGHPPSGRRVARGLVARAGLRSDRWRWELSRSMLHPRATHRPRSEAMAHANPAVHVARSLPQRLMSWVPLARRVHHALPTHGCGPSEDSRRPLSLSIESVHDDVLQCVFRKHIDVCVRPDMPYSRKVSNRASCLRFFGPGLGRGRC